jgi:hypothetical protein
MSKQSRDFIAALQISLGSGKALFAGVRNEHMLELVQSRTDRSGRVVLTYRI